MNEKMLNVMIALASVGVIASAFVVGVIVGIIF